MLIAKSEIIDTGCFPASSLSVASPAYDYKDADILTPPYAISQVRICMLDSPCICPRQQGFHVRES